MSKLSEIEILRKLANSLTKSNYYKNKYDDLMKDYTRKHPYVDSRYNQKNLEKRSNLINPIYSKYKEHKSNAEGYLFMWQQMGGEK